ncbi:MAG: hypothetical protein ACSHXY_09880 [Alphaproteobacteria bacterium]
MKPFEIFRTGTHTDSKGRKMVVTAAMLTALASNYAAAGIDTPIVVGHPKAADPAYGWIDKLTVEGESLIAHPKDVNPDFEAMVDQGAFRNRSVSLFPPNDPSNPKPGDFYPRHVGFLGAAAPAIPGLKAVEFCGGEDAYEFQSALQTNEDAAIGLQWIVNGLGRLFGGNTSFSAPAGLASPSTPSSPSPKDPNVMTDKKETPADFTSQQAALKAERDALKKDRADFAAQQGTVRLAEDTAFIKGLEEAGKLPPAAKEGMAEFMAALPFEATFDFSAADGTKSKVTPREYFKALIGGAKAVINFSEVSAEDGKDDPVVDGTDAQALALAAHDYQAAQAKAGRTITIDMAVAHVAAQKK